MDNTWSFVAGEYIQMEPWGPWSPWELQHLGVLDQWVSHRSRDVILQVETVIIDQSCNLTCPWGYGLENGICKPDMFVFENRQDLWVTPVHAISTSARTEMQSSSHTEWQWRTKVELPWFHKELVDVTTKSLPKKAPKKAALLDMKEIEKLTRAKVEQLEVALLPALYEGNRLTLTHDSDDYAMTVDGILQSPRDAIIARKLGIGYHTIELTRKDPKSGKLKRLQLPLSVISPIDLKFNPVTKIKLEGAKNGGFVKLQLHNRSRSEHAVRIEPEMIPSGWMALRLGNPILVLKPDQKAEVEIVIERMVAADVTPEPLPFSVRASFPGSDISEITAMFYVVAQDLLASGRKGKVLQLEAF